MDKSTARSRGMSLLEYLRQNGLDGYGSIILIENVRRVIGISYPVTATKKVFDSLSLQEMSAVDYTRNILLGEGKYLAKSNGNYRILLPSENAHQVESYIEYASSKLRRAEKLSKNTPKSDTNVTSNLAARLVMQRSSLTQSREAAALRR